MRAGTRVYAIGIRSVLRVFALFLAGVGAAVFLFSSGLPLPSAKTLLGLIKVASCPLGAADKSAFLPFLLGFDPREPAAVAKSIFPAIGGGVLALPAPREAAPAEAGDAEPPRESAAAVVEKTIANSGAKGYSPVEGLYVQNDSGYSFDLAETLGREIAFSGQKGPKVLILHTHTSEAYLDESRATSPYHSADQSENVVRVGAEIAAVLNEAGIETLHDKTRHDIPSYTGAYGRSADTARGRIGESPSIEIVLDIHRDAIEQSDGAFVKTLAGGDGARTAQVMTVVGTDKSGLEHPLWRDNLAFALKLQKRMNELYPSLARPINLRSERFNGHISDKALLIEVGSNANTLEEAIAGGRAFAKALADFLTKG